MPDVPGDFSRFTQRARNVLAAAEDLAQAAGVGVIGPEHLAVGLLAEPEGIAAQGHRRPRRQPGAAALRVRRCRTWRGTQNAPAGEPAQGGPAAARVPLGPGAAAALKGALRSALHLGHNYIGTEHILLGLVDGQDATAATLAGPRRDQGRRCSSRSGRCSRRSRRAAASPAQVPRTWIAGRSREKTGMYGTCCWVASVT